MLRMFRIFLVSVLVAVIATGCATHPKSKKEVESILAKPDGAVNAYLFSPLLIDDRSEVSIRINDTEVAVLKSGQFVRLHLLAGENYPFTFVANDVEGEEGSIRDIITPSRANAVKRGFYSEDGIVSAASFEMKNWDDDSLTTDGFGYFEYVEPLLSLPAIALLGTKYSESVAVCNAEFSLENCEPLLTSVPQWLQPPGLSARVASEKKRLSEEQREQQRLAAEASLPATVRRDKYMLQLSELLKTEQYQPALEIFPLIEALPVSTDPSLKFYYGEALYKTGEYSAAVRKLYEYILEQGRSARHYTRALEIVSQAEASL